MSQYIVDVDTETQAVLGWNTLLQSFVALVYRIDENGKKKGAPIFKIGGTPNQIDNIEVFMVMLASYLHLSDEVHSNLFFDRSQNR